VGEALKTKAGSNPVQYSRGPGFKHQLQHYTEIFTWPFPVPPVEVSGSDDYCIPSHSQFRGGQLDELEKTTRAEAVH
jgi:hypothetical protein